MTRTALPYSAPAATGQPPAGGRDVWFDAPDLLDPVTTPAVWYRPELTERAAKTLKCFDFSGRLTRRPPKLSQQRLALWVLWMRFDARRVYTEHDEVQGLLHALRKRQAPYRVSSRAPRVLPPVTATAQQAEAD